MWTGRCVQNSSFVAFVCLFGCHLERCFHGQYQRKRKGKVETLGELGCIMARAQNNLLTRGTTEGGGGGGGGQHPVGLDRLYDKPASHGFIYFIDTKALVCFSLK
jgi:hypothetical protein